MNANNRQELGGRNLGVPLNTAGRTLESYVLVRADLPAVIIEPTDPVTPTPKMEGAP